MIKRLLIYIKEMFPLQVYIPYTLVSFYGLYFTVQAINSNKPLQITRSSLIGVFSVFGIMLIMRIYDEFKDKETDSRLFPNRPMARGAAKYSDIRILGFAVFGLMLLGNFILVNTLVSFLAMMLFSLLTYKWFFRKELISNSLVLALLTHQQLTLFANYYIVAVAMYYSGNYEMNSLIIAGIFAFFFPITAWETSRKIRAAGKETNYITYSKLFGPRRATLLPLISMMITAALLIYIGIGLHFSIYYFIAVAILLIQLMVFYLMFIISPTEKNLRVKPVAEYTGTLFFIVLIVQLIVKFGICI